MTRHFYDASGINISLSVTLFFIAKSLLRVNAYDNSFFRNTLTLAVIPVYVDEESTNGALSAIPRRHALITLSEATKSYLPFDK